MLLKLCFACLFNFVFSRKNRNTFFFHSLSSNANACVKCRLRKAKIFLRVYVFSGGVVLIFFVLIFKNFENFSWLEGFLLRYFWLCLPLDKLFSAANFAFYSLGLFFFQNSLHSF